MLVAEHRSHPAGEIAAVVPQHVEVHLTIAGSEHGWVRRSGAGQVQEAAPKKGVICLSPIGVGDDVLALSAPIPETLHLYLPAELLRRLDADFRLPGMPAHSIRYAAGIRDEVIESIGHSLLAELHHETAGGRIYVETASLTLTARLLQKHCDSGVPSPVESSAHRLDPIRLRRVLDFIQANIESNITLVDLAAVAGYSPFHFARKFSLTMGIAPHRYISRLRLDAAMTELATSKLSLSEIAINAQFSSQASFTRAFRRATGWTPKEYRRLPR